MRTPSASFPVGLSDFRKLREANYIYVDKSLFIRDVLEQGAQVLLIPRPRRFGKTLNLSMLRYFLEKSERDHRALFEGLAIEKVLSTYAHFQKYPVIALTFKDVKYDHWEDAWTAISGVLANLYKEHRYLLDGDFLIPSDKKMYQAIMNQELGSAACATALQKLSEYLHNYYDRPVVCLIDEYDTPFHEAYLHAYSDKLVPFFRNLFSGVFKDNVHLYKGVLTGILRIAKESIFSGLNNLAVFSLLSREFASAFGFTEEEVQMLLKQTGQSEWVEQIRAWYNGYLFGEHITIYNPWSLINFLSRPTDGLKSYWVASGSNNLIRNVLFQQTSDVGADLEVLLQGGSVEKPLEENVVLRDLDRRPSAVWGFLLFTGYLKVTKLFQKEDRLYGHLSIPNREILLDFKDMTQDWFVSQFKIESRAPAFFQGLLQGDTNRVQTYLSELLATSVSYYDLAGEKTYHTLVLGLLVSLSADYDIHSNRESGYGRYDLMLCPKRPKHPGVILELKILDDSPTDAEVEKALQAALQQIREKNYAAELRVRKAQPIYAYAVVFAGKRVWVKADLTFNDGKN